MINLNILLTLNKVYIKWLIGVLIGWIINIIAPFKEPIILNYHGSSNKGILEMNAYPSFQEYANDFHHVKVENFKKQINWLRNNGYKFINIKNLDRNINQKKIVLLTFDDVPLSAKPLFDFLVSENIPFVSFVCANFAENPGEEWMGWENLKYYLGSELMEIGNHSYNHISFKGMDSEEIYSEITRSREMIAERLGIVQPIEFAFPYGKFDDWQVEFLLNLEIKGVFLTYTKKINHDFKKYQSFRRIPMNKATNISMLKTSVKGKMRYL